MCLGKTGRMFGQKKKHAQKPTQRGQACPPIGELPKPRNHRSAPASQSVSLWLVANLNEMK